MKYSDVIEKHICPSWHQLVWDLTAYYLDNAPIPTPEGLDSYLTEEIKKELSDGFPLPSKEKHGL